MYGLIQFTKKYIEAGIKPILGALFDDPIYKNRNAMFFVKNNLGYYELCKIITFRKIKDNFSLFEIINNYQDKLFVFTSSIELLKISI